MHFHPVSNIALTFLDDLIEKSPEMFDNITPSVKELEMEDIIQIYEKIGVSLIFYMRCYSSLFLVRI